MRFHSARVFLLVLCGCVAMDEVPDDSKVPQDAALAEVDADATFDGGEASRSPDGSQPEASTATNAVDAAADAADARADGDAGSSLAPSDAGDGGFIGCLPAQVQAYLDDHRTCSRDDECTIVGSCSGSLFHPVRGDAKDEAQRLLQSVHCGSDGPQFNPRCERGRCVKRWNGRFCGRPASESKCQRTHERYSVGCPGGYGGDLCMRPCDPGGVASCGPDFSCQVKLFAGIEQCESAPLPFTVCAPEPACEVLLTIRSGDDQAIALQRGAFATPRNLELFATNLTQETKTFSYRRPCPGGPALLGLGSYDAYGTCLAGACVEMPAASVRLTPGQRISLGTAKVGTAPDACNPSGLAKGEYGVRFGLAELAGARVCGPEALELTAN